MATHAGLSGDVRIRPYTPADFHALLAINQDNVPAVGTVEIDQFAWLLGQAWICLVAEVAERPAGFVLAMIEGSSYASANYRWFARRHARFAYVDRIAIDAEHTGKGLGAALYEDLMARLTARDDTPPVLTCEVNTRPPNPGSLRFHKRQGFREVDGLVSEDSQKAVALMERRLV